MPEDVDSVGLSTTSPRGRETDTLTAIVLVSAQAVTGGLYRALIAVREYRRHGIEPLVLAHCASVGPGRKVLADLRKDGIKVIGLVNTEELRVKLPLLRKSVTKMLLLSFPSTLKHCIRMNMSAAVDASLVVSMHETYEAALACLTVAEELGLRKAIVLQLPPFYSPERARILKSVIRCWYSLVLGRARGLATALVDLSLRDFEMWRMSKLLSKFDLVIAVSRAIPVEMGWEWHSRMKVLDPGVALPDHDIALINKLRLSSGKKKREAGHIWRQGSTREGNH